ncbi:RICIN domain-containing protein [Luteipulveratus mongoliensis]|uniref:RICIN domain-containing protein n=1 Tax=Luteipulveratus mongoliensis TaxID=571913 RepID=UPI000695FA63|nr:RICIN domain-containing protein [Luteipulveratus mongoliensis]
MTAHTRHPRLALTAAAALGLSSMAAAASADTAPAGTTTYTVTTSTPVPYKYAVDTPAASYIDKDGSFWFQQSAALYAAKDVRFWDFYSGGDFDTAKRSATSDAKDPANPLDANNDTTWRCNNSPTGVESTYAPDTSYYSQRNFCDLVGVWVDPDTGDWRGIVHNEFTPQPFGDGLHYDSLDWAISTDQGKTWQIRDHIITSPYSTKRGDTTAFPHETYHFGDGDPRLYVDTASGYFYLFYSSHIVNKGGTGDSSQGLTEHVARAPMSGKLATGSWKKYHNGSWDSPGVGGAESSLVSTSTNKQGYIAAAKDYDPSRPGTVSAQQQAGTIPARSDLLNMNIAWNAYLGEYVATPSPDSGRGPLDIFGTKDLATQKWHRIGDTGPGYQQQSWYRWLVDPINKTSENVVGKSFRSYCVVSCNSGYAEYTTVTVDSSAPAKSPIRTDKPYLLQTAKNQVLIQAPTGTGTTTNSGTTHNTRAGWTFTATGDGAYTISNKASGLALTASGSGDAGRAWGAKPTVTAIGDSGPSAAQQWFVQRVVTTPTNSGSTTPTDRFVLVNRYSGLALSLASATGADTTPVRAWTNTTGNPVGGTRTGGDQQLAFIRW